MRGRLKTSEWKGSPGADLGEIVEQAAGPNPSSTKYWSAGVATPAPERQEPSAEEEAIDAVPLAESAEGGDDVDQTAADAVKMVVRRYLTAPLPISKLPLLKDLRAKYKKFKKGGEEWSMGLPELKPHHICADYLKGLIRVVPQFGARDDAGKYCISGFAIDLYLGLLQDR
ncbi:hypothetical protein Cgig2_030443 [Carnegiea gigantea]|uniref:Uncharacterized protein n=1 Tax=Carnegiea gigantea TaxID=171969 RepID=A0A9Q1KR71_9CARY|nr:hypothetical protein Cgig2_030443 [Carnegiea gigantea]